jgi:hypothetical protein
VVLFIVMVPILIRLNREYRMEAQVLEGIGTRRKLPAPPTYPRRTVFLFVDSFDLATLAALRYARSLRPTTLRAVHFVIDSSEATKLRQEWLRANTGVVLDFIDCPDRRITRAAAELVNAEAELPGVGVTAILPRRGYSPLLGRLLHDRTADKIAGVVSRIPHAVATIVPFDVRSRLESLHGRQTGHGDHPLTAVPDGKPGSPRGAAVPRPDGQATGTGPARQAASQAPADEGAVPEPAGQAAGQTTEASGQTRDPGAGNTDPSAGTTDPSAETLEPDVGTTDPDARTTDPDAGTTEPAAETLEPDAQTLGPDAELARAGETVQPDAGGYERPAPRAGVRPLGSLSEPGRATVEGRVIAVEIRPVEQNTVLAAELADSTGQLTALFYGRSHIPGLECGSRVRLRGQVGIREGGVVMINPAYELLGQGQPEPPPGESPPGGKDQRRGKRP